MPLPRSYPELHRLPADGSPRQLALPPDDLLPDTFAARLYGMLGPLTQWDFDSAWSLLVLVNAIGGEYQLVEDWVRDTPEGPGWSLLLDVDRCPPEALGWLAQFVGVRLLAGADAETSRARIRSTDGFHRGTPSAMRGAAAATLTGAKTVVFRERNGDKVAEPIDYAYYLDVVTYDSQTPDPVATEAALLSQKPAGIVMSYRHVSGQDYQLLRDTNATYQAVKTKYATYQAVREDLPV